MSLYCKCKCLTDNKGIRSCMRECDKPKFIPLNIISYPIDPQYLVYHRLLKRRSKY